MSVFKREISIFLLYVCISFLLTYPMAVDFYNYPLGHYLDTTACLYNFWWQYYSRFELKTSVFFNPLINYPDGYSMTFFPLFFVYGTISLPYQALFSTPASLGSFFNIINLVSFILTSWLGYLFFKSLLNERSSAFFAGLAFSFLPFRFWHLAHSHIFCFELLLLPIYFYFKLEREKKYHLGVIFGLTVSLLFYQSPVYIIYLGLFFFLRFFWLLFADRASLSSRRFFYSICISALIFFILSFPYARKIFIDLKREVVPIYPTLQEQSRFSANIIGFVLPSSTQTFYRIFIKEDFFSNENGVLGYEIFLGYSIMVCAIIGFLKARKRLPSFGFWILVIFVFGTISLGPFLHIGSKSFYNFHLPFFYLEKVLPFLKADRTPVRFVVFAMLSLILISGSGLCWLRERFSSRVYNFFYLFFVVFLLLELNQAPIPLSRVEPSKFHRELLEEPGNFSVLDLPFLPDIYRYSGTYQSYHHKNLIIDLTARKGSNKFYEDPIFFYLDEPLRFFILDEEKKPGVIERLRSEIIKKRLKYIVIFTKFVEKDKLDQLDELIMKLEPEASFFRDGGLFKIYRFPL